MKTVYRTKTDINGNTYYLTLDHSAMTYSDFDGRIPDSKPVTIGKREMRSLRAAAIENGYTCKD